MGEQQASDDDKPSEGGLYGELKRHGKEVAGISLGCLLLGFLMKTSSFGQIGHGFVSFHWFLWPIVAVLIACRSAMRVMEWRYLLNRLGQRVSWPHAIVAQLMGDAGQLLPGGIYLSNVAIQRSQKVDLAKTFAATWAMMLLEGLVSLIVLMFLGVAGYWYSHLIAGFIFVGFVVFMAWVSRRGTIEGMDERANGHRKIVHQVVAGAQHLLEGIRDLIQPRTVITATAFTVPYLVFTIAAFYVIVRGLGVNIAWAQAAAIYSFVLAVIDTNPLPTDVGISEGSGLLIFVANGVPEATGLVAMLLIRIAIVTTTAILFGIAFWYFKRARQDVLQGHGDQEAAPLDQRPQAA